MPYGTSDYLRDTAVVDVTTTNTGANGQLTGKAAVVVLGVAGGGAAPAGTSTDPSYVAPIGCVASASFTPAAAAYGAGDIMDVAKEFAFTYANGLAIPTGSLIRILDVITKIDISALQASEGAYALQCYGVTPPSAQADQDAWTLASADLPSYSGSISLGTPVDLGAALYIKQSNIDVDIKLTTSSLWGRLVTTPGFTATAVARQVFIRAAVI